MTDNNSDDYDDNIFFCIQDKYNTENNCIIETDDTISEMTMNCDTPSILNASTDGYLYGNLCGNLCGAPLENELNRTAFDELFGLSYY